MPKLLTKVQKATYFKSRDAGLSMRESCNRAGFSLTSARTLEKGGRDRRKTGYVDGASTETLELAEPIPYSELKPEAREAHDDFAAFQRRYFGKLALPWQVEAAERLVEWLDVPERTFVVVNAPPGSGKTTLFTRDIPLWLVVRNRSIRCMLGASTGALASRYTNTIRRFLERPDPAMGDPDMVARGLALDAVASLTEDFGRFKPADREMWVKDAFVVAQSEGRGAITAKEPTFSAYGFDQGYLGGRYNFVVWDDLVDPKRVRSQEARDQLKSDWDDLAETRLEQGGVLLLQGQRIGADDLYRYCLDKSIPTLIDPETLVEIESTPKYYHIKYKAHYDDRCTPENHIRGKAKPYPEGCLLYPDQLDWRTLQGIKANNANNFEVLYQQEDTDPGNVLVPKEWIYGSQTFPGCLDAERDRLQIPMGLQPPLFSCMSVDPSPTQYWGITWWLYSPATELRYLVDLERRKMDAPDFLDYNELTKTYSGLLEEWHETSKKMGIPISHVVVENNAAQRFLLQFRFVHNWTALRNCLIVPHTTHRNKSDPELGVQMLAPHYQHGRVRLPWKAHSEGRLKTMRFMEELTTYPDSRTTDLVMSHWFFENKLPQIFQPDHGPSRSWRPSWLAKQSGKSAEQVALGM